MFSTENNDNAVDMLQDVRRSERAFKLPTGNLSFSGTIQLVQSLRPIVDPVAALTASGRFVNTEEKSQYDVNENSKNHNPLASEVSEEISADGDECTESIADSDYVDFSRRDTYLRTEDKSMEWSNDRSYATRDPYDSGIRSPDMFASEDEEEPAAAPEPFWNFLEDFEQRDKGKVRKLEEKLRGILPPPSVTTMRSDVTEMLNKYYAFLPAFTNEVKVDTPKIDPVTPKEMVSSVEIPLESEMPVEEMASVKAEKHDQSFETKAKGKSTVLDMCSETEAKETPWPEMMKRNHYDVYYNLTSHSEKLEMLRMRYGQRFVGRETESSISVHSGGLQSPSSAEKRKALRHKREQAKSPGRRLSHLARRRQAFCNAATIQEKTLESNFKMVDMDINFRLRKKLQKEAEERSRRLERTQMTTDEKTSKMKTDATQSDFLKRKFYMMDDQPEASTSKIAKSLSFGGDTVASMKSQSLNRRASEVCTSSSKGFSEKHKKKLLWAVADALRGHGWRMSTPGFRQKAEALALLTRRLLTLPPHAAKFSSSKFSTTETFLKLARQYAFAIIQGRSIEDCFQEEQRKLSNEKRNKLTGYVSVEEYEKYQAEQAAASSTSTLNSTSTSQVKDSNCNGSVKPDQPRSASINAPQERLIDIASTSNSSCGFYMVGDSPPCNSNFKSSFEDAAKMKARRQINFDEY